MHTATAAAPPPGVTARFPALPALPLSALPLPDALAEWLREAEVRLEAALADYDAALLLTDRIELAAAAAVDELMSWVRSTVGRLSTPEGRELVRGELRQRCALAWRLEADAAVSRSYEDPGAVETFMRDYLAMCREQAARGYAALVALSP
ncbi:MAG: hypothetical protein H6739_04130 [Alphaproteobacteria bacterium]|nr:hypothetical protein [Alphaproteobacteria bacterium]